MKWNYLYDGSWHRVALNEHFFDNMNLSDKIFVYLSVH